MPRKNKQEYNAYMRSYLKGYRQKDRKMLAEYKRMMGIPNGRKKKRRKT